MATTDGPAAPALTKLAGVIREYSLFQAVLQVIKRLRDAHPTLDEEDRKSTRLNSSHWE